MTGTVLALRLRPLALTLAAVIASASLAAADAVADRRAVEQVYDKHRLGTKPPFDEAMPPELLEGLVQREVMRERVLQKVFGVTVTPAQVEAEVRRIETTTKAPEVLAELKAALGGDPARFAQTVARPIVVERLLRAHFENDVELHAPTRRSAEALRGLLLRFKPEGPAAVLAKARDLKVAEAQELTWSLRRREGPGPTPAISTPSQPAKGSASSRSYTVESTVDFAKMLTPPREVMGAEPTPFFEDLDPTLQRVLNLQLRSAGDISAVIESAQGYQIFVTVGRSTEELKVLAFALPKRSFDEWLAGEAKR